MCTHCALMRDELTLFPGSCRMERLACNQCWTELQDWAAATKCNHVFCKINPTVPFFFLLVSGIPCAQRHFSFHRTCPKCGRGASETDVRTLDLNNPTGLGCPPTAALALATDSLALWREQGRTQDERRREQTREAKQALAEAKQQLTQTLQELEEMRASRQALLDLTAQLRADAGRPAREAQQQQQAPPPSPLARIVSPAQHQQQPHRAPDVFRGGAAVAASPSIALPSPENVFSRFRHQQASPAVPMVAKQVVRPTSLMDVATTPSGGIFGAAFPTKPVTPSIQAVKSRRFY